MRAGVFRKVKDASVKWVRARPRQELGGYHIREPIKALLSPCFPITLLRSFTPRFYSELFKTTTTSGLGES